MFRGKASAFSISNVHYVGGTLKSVSDDVLKRPFTGNFKGTTNIHLTQYSCTVDAPDFSFLARDRDGLESCTLYLSPKTLGTLFLIVHLHINGPGKKRTEMSLSTEYDIADRPSLALVASVLAALLSLAGLVFRDTTANLDATQRLLVGIRLRAYLWSPRFAQHATIGLLFICVLVLLVRFIEGWTTEAANRPVFW